MILKDKKLWLSKEFIVAVAIFDLTVLKEQEATKASLRFLTPKYMKDGELTASLHFLEGWHVIKRRISEKKTVNYTICEEDFLAIQSLHKMCWGENNVHQDY